MKKALLLLMMMVAGIVVKPCSCDDDFFCSYFSDSSIVVYGYKIGDVDTAGIRFKVIDSWGVITANDTITIWNDSLIAWTVVGGNGLFLCADDTKEKISTTDTVLLNIKLPYAGAAYSSPGDYLFNHWMCGLDILWVKNGMVKDSNWYYHDAPITAVIEESIADYKNRLINNINCEPTYIISSVEKALSNPDFKLYLSNKQLIIPTVGAPVQLNLYNITGQLVYTRNTAETQHDLSSLSPALYIAEVRVNGEVFQQKVVMP